MVARGTPIARTKIPMRKWATYLCLTSVESVSGMKLHRDLKVSRLSVWFMMHRLREAWAWRGTPRPFDGSVEVDEIYFGGKRKNMSKAKRREVRKTVGGRGSDRQNRGGRRQGSASN